MFNTAVARIGLFCFILWCQGYTPGPCVLSAFPPDLYSQCLTPSLVFILSFVILLSSTTPSLLSHFLPSFKSILCFCCSCFMLCAVWVICWNAVLIFCGWLIVPGISIAYLPSLPLESNWPLLYCWSASYIQLLQWNSFPHFLESSLMSGCPCFWWKPYSGVVLGPHTGSSPLWLLLPSILRATENPQDGEEAMS